MRWYIVCLVSGLIAGSSGLFAQDEVVAFRLVLSQDSVPVTELAIGEPATLEVYVRDIRTDGGGIFSAYLDVAFDGQLIGADIDSLAFGPSFTNASHGKLSTSLLDEVGAITNALLLPSSGEHLLWSIDIQGTSAGVASFIGNPADTLPLHETTVFGRDTSVEDQEMTFEDVSASIVPEPDAALIALPLFMLLCRRSRRPAI